MKDKQQKWYTSKKDRFSTKFNSCAMQGYTNRKNDDNTLNKSLKLKSPQN